MFLIEGIAERVECPPSTRRGDVATLPSLHVRTARRGLGTERRRRPRDAARSPMRSGRTPLRLRRPAEDIQNRADLGISRLVVVPNSRDQLGPSVLKQWADVFPNPATYPLGPGLATRYPTPCSVKM